MTSTETFFQREFAPKRLAFWIFWFGSHIGLFIYGFLKQKNDASLAVLNSIGLSVWTSRGAGLCLAYDCSLILLPVCRNIIRYLRLTFLNKFIPFDENIWFHRQVAYSMLFFTLVHTFAHYINFYNVEVLGLFPTWSVHYKTWAGLTGHFMLLIMVLMYTSAYLPMRNQSFETFWYTHHLSFFFMLCLYFHAYGCFVKTGTGICKPYYTYRYALVGGIIYFFERVLREVRSRRATRITKVVAHPERVIEIQFDKRSFRYKPGQYLFLNVPTLSKWQWHPFTITSAPDDQYVSVHIRQVGDFTTALGDLLGCNNNSAKRLETESIVIQNKSDVLPTIRVDGPFGAPAEDVFDNEVVILVGCGIGVTPFASILKNIWYQHRNNRPSKLRRVEFYWICRDTEAFEWFQSLLKALEASQMEPGFLTFNIYLTQKLRQSTIQNIVINDVSGSYDPLTRLTSRTHYGRPNFIQVFDDLTKSIRDGKYLPKKDKDPTNVGVYYCGPPPLARTLKVACKKAASSDIRFSFHKEHF